MPGTGEQALDRAELRIPATFGPRDTALIHMGALGELLLGEPAALTRSSTSETMSSRTYSTRTESRRGCWWPKIRPPTPLARQVA